MAEPGFRLRQLVPADLPIGIRLEADLHAIGNVRQIDRCIIVPVGARVLYVFFLCNMNQIIVIRTACACFINANITLPLYAKAMSLPLDEVIRMVASVNPAIKDLNGFIILATIPFNVLKVGLNYIVGQLLFVRLRAAKIVPKAV